MLPYVALSWVTGTLADRFRRDRILRGDAGRCGSACSRSSGSPSPRTGCWSRCWRAPPRSAPARPPTRPWPRRCPASPGTRDAAPPTCWSPSRWRPSWSGPALGGLLLAPLTRPCLPAVAVGLDGGRAAAACTGVAAAGPRGPVRAPLDGAGPSLRTARRSAGVPRAIGTVALLNGVLAAVGADAAAAGDRHLAHGRLRARDRRCSASGPSRHRCSGGAARPRAAAPAPACCCWRPLWSP